jgi:DNA-binding winged helix-turn-helix (wHTH) protein
VDGSDVHYRFRRFDLDLESRRLLEDGREVPLPPKAFLLLELLVSRHPRALSRAQIRDHLWPSTFTSESNLHTVVAEVRGALGPDASPLVRTVRGFGYAFAGPLEVLGAPSSPLRGPVRFRLFCQDREAALVDGENLIGRTDEAAVWIEAATVSRRHARITVAEGRATIEDLQSRNGTWLEGERIDSVRPLADGDEIRLGRVPATFRSLRVDSTRTGSHG